MSNTTAESGDPHRAVGIDENILGRTAFQTFFSPGFEGRKADPVETHKAYAGSQPEISIWTLLDPAHGLDASVGAPRSARVVRDAIGGVKSPGVDRERNETE